MIQLDNLNGLAEHIKAATLLLKITHHNNLINNSDAVSVALDAIFFSKKNHDITKSNLFSFTAQNVNRFIYRWLSQNPKKHIYAKRDIVDNTKPIDIIIQEELRKNIEHTISQLPDKKRRCVELIYYDNYTKSDVAKELKTSPQYVDYILKSLKKEFNVFQEKEE